MLEDEEEDKPSTKDLAKAVKDEDGEAVEDDEEGSPVKDVVKAAKKAKRVQVPVSPPTREGATSRWAGMPQTAAVRVRTGHPTEKGNLMGGRDAPGAAGAAAAQAAAAAAVQEGAAAAAEANGGSDAAVAAAAAPAEETTAAAVLPNPEAEAAAAAEAKEEEEED